MTYFYFMEILDLTESSISLFHSKENVERHARLKNKGIKFIRIRGSQSKSTQKIMSVYNKRKKEKN